MTFKTQLFTSSLQKPSYFLLANCSNEKELSSSTYNIVNWLCTFKARYKLRHVTKAVKNYHVSNGRVQNSLLFPCQCHKSHLNHWSMVFSYYQLLLFYLAPLINDSNCVYGIGRGKVMNSAHGRYRCDSLSVLYQLFVPPCIFWNWVSYCLIILTQFQKTHDEAKKIIS